MKKQASPKKKAYDLIYLLLGLFLLSWILIWGGNSFLRANRLNQKIQRTEREISVTKAKNDSLQYEGNRLRTDPSAAEEVEREKYGMLKPNETLWIFKGAQPDSLPAKGK